MGCIEGVLGVYLVCIWCMYCIYGVYVVYILYITGVHRYKYGKEGYIRVKRYIIGIYVHGADDV